MLKCCYEEMFKVREVKRANGIQEAQMSQGWIERLVQGVLE